VLKVSLHSDLKIIDPIWTTALISTHHGSMVYDTLFALDEKLAVKPQMVDKWEVSPTSSPGPSPCATAWNGTTASR
jgi:peptide/nickel transport system substrate-binding protein